jgi:carbohydrate diacid regulator
MLGCLDECQQGAHMTQQQELQHALSDLNRLLGISLELSSPLDSETDSSRAISQIQTLVQAYQEHTNRDYSLHKLLTSRISVSEIQTLAARLHLSTDATYGVFLLDAKNPFDDSSYAILHHMFHHQMVHLIKLEDTRVALLYSQALASQEEEILNLAHFIVDTLNTEALLSVQLAFTLPDTPLSQLFSSYEKVLLALKIGQLFYSEQTIFSSSKIGIGQLIYHLPKQVCQNFLQELFHEDTPWILDAETNLTVQKFFQNNLNIAETSRQLHMHRNTLIYRLEQIQKRTNLDLRKFEDALTFKLALMIGHYLQTDTHTERKHPE